MGKKLSCNSMISTQIFTFHLRTKCDIYFLFRVYISTNRNNNDSHFVISTQNLKFLDFLGPDDTHPPLQVFIPSIFKEMLVIFSKRREMRKNYNAIL